MLKFQDDNFALTVGFLCDDIDFFYRIQYSFKLSFCRFGCIGGLLVFLIIDLVLESFDHGKRVIDQGCLFTVRDDQVLRSQVYFFPEMS